LFDSDIDIIYLFDTNIDNNNDNICLFHSDIDIVCLFDT
jgi:hypothetical protein